MARMLVWVLLVSVAVSVGVVSFAIHPPRPLVELVLSGRLERTFHVMGERLSVTVALGGEESGSVTELREMAGRRGMVCIVPGRSAILLAPGRYHLIGPPPGPNEEGAGGGGGAGR